VLIIGWDLSLTNEDGVRNMAHIQGLEAHNRA